MRSRSWWLPVRARWALRRPPPLWWAPAKPRSAASLSATRKRSNSREKLTRGEPAVTDVLAASETEPAIVQIEASLENLSEHPIAKAVVAYAASLGTQSSHPLDTAVQKEARTLDTTLYKVTNFRAHPGKGIKGEVEVLNERRKMLLGNRALLAAAAVALPQEIDARAAALETEGKTMLFLADGTRTLGAIAV